MKDIRYTFYLISSDRTTNKMVEFGKKTFIFLLSLLAIAIVAIVVSYFIFIPKVIKYQDLKKGIAKYEKKNETYNEMLKNFDKMKAMNEYVRELLGIPESENINIDSLLASKSSNEISNVENIIISLDNIPTRTPVNGIITQEFEEDTLYGGNVHNGIDISGAVGTPIVAAASGLVVFSGWTNDLGNVIIIVHDNKYVTVYGHNSKNIVKERQIVKRGQLIALLGNSGHSTGPHLHFEIWENTKTRDPREFIAEYGKND
ncbi:MAG: M23 family metallopeptidase [Candidatus Marinimicrobia bacterium]|jgi:murein DD-endopeptidase MepM/ murein hydrolase activator NlpD|nr:M23 family metallopeptidase [Candidatus Neomarinimicrobiota bacterium]